MKGNNVDPIKVSIIVPVYNAQMFLKRCLESLILQSEKEIEILLIDDGSMDLSAQMMEDYAKMDERIRIFYQKNGGAACARNTGLENARGKYMLFVDADDALSENAVSVFLQNAEEFHADIVRCNLCYCSEDGIKQDDENAFENHFFVLQNSFRDMIYPKMLAGIEMNSVCRTLFLRELVIGLQFNETLETAEDLVFSIQVYTRAKSFLYITDALYLYYRQAGGLTGRGLSVFKKYRCNLYVSHVLIKYLKRWKMDTPKNRFLAYRRLWNITFSKLGRMFSKPKSASVS